MSLEVKLRSTLPAPAYLTLRRGYSGARRLAGRNPGRGRVLPDFLVVGTPKSGTTSLYDWITRHPLVSAATQKEVHYFDYRSFRGEDWYRSHFPLASALGPGGITGEASPTYLSHPWAPGRVSRLLPRAKLIAVFRNPVDRAYSQFQMARREHEEPLESFEDALAAEDERLESEIARSLADPLYNSWPLGNWSYKLRSRYAEQVERWLPLFPREQFLFLSAEELLADPARSLATVDAFLELPPHDYGELPLLHTAKYDPLPAGVRAHLAEYFRPHNERLAELVGIDFGWDA